MYMTYKPQLSVFGPHIHMKPQMYIHYKFGDFLLLIYLKSIWLLDQPEELTKVEGNLLFFFPYSSTVLLVCFYVSTNFDHYIFLI